VHHDQVSFLAEAHVLDFIDTREHAGVDRVTAKRLKRGGTDEPQRARNLTRRASSTLSSSTTTWSRP